MLSTNSLFRIAAVGGVFAFGSAFYFKYSIEKGLKSSDYYKESLDTLRAHKGIAYLMGEPIRDGSLDLGDNKNNFSTGTEAQFQVPVKGTKKAGVLYLWASRPDMYQKWCVDRLELGLKDEPNKRIRIIGTKNDDVTDLPETNGKHVDEGVRETPSSIEKTRDDHGPTTDDDGSSGLSHSELKAFLQGALAKVVQADPVLKDLHPQVTVEEVQALIDLEHGQAMKVYIEKADGDYWSVVVPREATVHDLKVALKHHVALTLNRKGVKKKISWHYIWKTYWLWFDKEKLTNDNCMLVEYGIKNKSTLTFLKKLKERQRISKRSGE